MRSNHALTECYTPGHSRPEKPRLANAPLPVPDAPCACRVLTGDADACANPYINSRPNTYLHSHPATHRYPVAHANRHP